MACRLSQAAKARVKLYSYMCKRDRLAIAADTWLTIVYSYSISQCMAIHGHAAEVEIL